MLYKWIVGWHEGGPGACQYCGAESPDRAAVRCSDLITRVLLCEPDARRIADNDPVLKQWARRRLEGSRPGML